MAALAILYAALPGGRHFLQDGADDDNLAPTLTRLRLGHHLPCRQLAGVKDAKLAHLDDPLDVLPLRFNDRLANAMGRIGDGDIQPSKRLHRARHHGGYRIPLRDVRLPGQSPAAHSLDRLHHFTGLVWMGAVVDDNVRALGSQAQRYPPADSPGCPGDQCHLSCQAFHRPCTSLLACATQFKRSGVSRP